MTRASLDWYGRWVLPLAAVVVCLLGIPRAGRAADPPSGPAILQDLKSFQQVATVLMIAAHPDDENTQLIAYLARGRGYRMAYLSVTRGDGGQNVLGPEFDEELGVIRTQELLAARRLDGGRQFFTRAIDFGFSKNAAETLHFWDRQQVTADVVRVIRTFRPDVIVARFNPDIAGGVGTHGHHTASAIIGRDAFKLAGDATAFPEQLQEGLTVWQPKRILLNTGFGARGGGAVVTIDAGGTDPVLNESFSSIAARSRGMHKSQGLGGGFGGGGRGGGGGGGPAPQSFTLLGGDPATTDIMDGIDTTWARLGPGGAKIVPLIADAIARFDPKDPSASVPALLEIKKLAAALPNDPPDPVIIDRRDQLDRIIANCLGLTVETTVPNAEVTPDETLKLHCAVTITSNVPVKWGTSGDPMVSVPKPNFIDLRPGQTAVRDVSTALDPHTPVSQPYWLRAEPAPGIFRVSEAYLIGRPENPPVHPFTYSFEVGGQTLAIPSEIVQLTPGDKAHPTRRLEVIAPVTFSFPYDVALFWQKPDRPYVFEITAARDNTSGTVALEAPPGWKVEPPSKPFLLAKAGQKTQVLFDITPPNGAASGTLTARATINGVTYSNQRKEILYDHIPPLLLQPAARVKAVALDIQHRCKNPVGYLPGAGDSIPQALAEMGITVKTLTGADLTPEKLGPLDAVVIGVRAFNVRTDLTADHLKELFAYAEAGGTVIEQYNRPDQLRNNNLAPFPLHLSGLRVTDETAAVKFLVPDHPVLNTPNKITPADFENWVQERNIYLPDQWDPKFTPILGMAEPGETPPNSSLLIAQHDKGYFVYTSLVFFRQLPAGNPGAYRLFANLISLGKP